MSTLTFSVIVMFLLLLLIVVRYGIPLLRRGTRADSKEMGAIIQEIKSIQMGVRK